MKLVVPLGKKQNIITENHLSAVRNYALRAGLDKPELSELAKKFDIEYWDGDRKTGYGGYTNDGRWKKIAKNLSDRYGLSSGASILDIGCGKGYLLAELKKLNSQFAVQGVDISRYALSRAEPEVAEFLSICEADQIDYKENSFDLVVSMNCLHNLQLPQLFSALQKIQSVAKKNSYICVESYRNETEKWNLMQWQLTCECFFSPEEWVWIFDKSGYSGDYEFIYFA